MKRLIQSPLQLSVLIKTTRKARRLTQAEIASSLGISQNRFSELERDASGLTVDRLLELTKALGLELSVQKSGTATNPTSSPQASDW
jgi:HTH-type transcriptional regulator / antitoxin HipB